MSSTFQFVPIGKPDLPLFKRVNRTVCRKRKAQVQFPPINFASSHETISVVWLAALLAIAIGYGLLLIRRSPYSLWENVLYLPTYLWGRLLWHVHFANDAPPELLGGAVLVANHRSSVDPFFVQLSANRRVHWMVAREYCENPVSGPLLRALQVIPTNRSGMDTFATKLAIRLAKEGRLVGMFPEGRLNHTRAPLVSFRSGAALVALRAGVPMIPIHILGSPYRREVWSPLTMPANVRITFGEPIDPNQDCRQNSESNSMAHPSELETSQPSNSLNRDGDLASQIGHDEASADRPNPANDEGRRKRDSAKADELILRWARQIVTMAGYPDWPVEVCNRRKPLI